MMYGGGHGAAVLMLSAIGGYWVLERSSGHKGNLKRVGEWLGGAIILLSVLGVAYHVSGAVSKCRQDGMMKGGFCPFSSKAPAPNTK